MSADSSPPVDGFRCRSSGGVFGEQLRCGEVGAVAAEQRDAVDPQVSAGQAGAYCDAVEPRPAEHLGAGWNPEADDGRHHDEEFEDAGEDE